MRYSRPTPAYWQLDLLVISLLITIGLLGVFNMPWGVFLIAGISFGGIALWIWENSDALAADVNHRPLQRAENAGAGDCAAEPATR
jgi:hypothetical protein